MDTEQLFSPDGSSLDIGSRLPDIDSLLSSILGPIMWVSIIITVAFIALYVASILRRRKVENAILDIQKVIHEMNERDKKRNTQPPMPARSQFSTDMIARSEPNEKPTT